MDCKDAALTTIIIWFLHRFISGYRGAAVFQVHSALLVGKYDLNGAPVNEHCLETEACRALSEFPLPANKLSRSSFQGD